MWQERILEYFVLSLDSVVRMDIKTVVALCPGAGPSLEEENRKVMQTRYCTSH